MTEVLIGIISVITGVVATGFFAYRRISAVNSSLDASQFQIASLSTEIEVAKEKLSQASQIQEQLLEKQSQFEQSERDLNRLKLDYATLQTANLEREKNFKEQIKLLEEAKNTLSDTFKALSADALKHNNSQFLELAKSNLEKFQSQAKDDLEKKQTAISELLKPIKESLEGVNKKIVDVDKLSQSTSAVLTSQIKSLIESEKGLRDGTEKLVNALRRPQVRGRWGEMQLRRVVEMAGMINYCDFTEQQHTESTAGGLRPDMVVQLPNDRTIVVDSKAPLEAYLNSLEAADENERQEKLSKHASLVQSHINSLSAKSYWNQFDKAPEFVIMFLPGEMFFSAALQQQPSLIEQGVEKKVIIATPTTLIALLQAVAYGWKQQQVNENAKQISELGKTLYERLVVLSEHFNKIGKGLNSTVKAYNDAVGSVESRVFVSARRFNELGSGNGKVIHNSSQVDTAVRQISELDIDNEI